VVKEGSPRGEGTIGLYKAAVPNKPRTTAFTFTFYHVTFSIFIKTATFL
jgi:hypothetical protein